MEEDKDISNEQASDQGTSDREVIISQPRISKRFITVEPLMFIICVADSLSGSVITNLVLTRSCETHFHFNKSICSELENSNHNQSNVEAIIQPYTAVILTGMSFISVLLPAIMSLFLGPWSDDNGRKSLIIIPSLGYCFKYFLLGILSCIPTLDSTIALLTVIPVAVTGGIVNLVSAMYSYISDITSEDNRSFRMSIFDAFAYFGTIVGLLSSSYLFKAGGSYGYLLVLGLSSALIFITSIATYILIPESVQRTEGGKGLLHIFELKLLKEMFRVCFKKREGFGRAVIFLVISSLTLTIAAWEGEANVQFLYTRLWFGWSIKEYTLWNSINIATAFIGLVIGTTILAKWLKVSDAMLGIISYSMKTSSLLYFAFIPANAPVMMYFVGLMGLFGGLGGPAGRAVLSKSVPPEDLGKVFALTSSGEALLPLAFSPIYTFLYNSTIHTLPSAFLLLSTVLCTFSIIAYITIYVIQNSRWKNRYSVMEDSNDVE